MIELGPSHKTIHKVNEHVAIEDLQVLADIYINLLERLLLTSNEDVQEQEEIVRPESKAKQHT